MLPRLGSLSQRQPLDMLEADCANTMCLVSAIGIFKKACRSNHALRPWTFGFEPAKAETSRGRAGAPSMTTGSDTFLHHYSTATRRQLEPGSSSLLSQTNSRSMLSVLSYGPSSMGGTSIMYKYTHSKA